MSKKTENTFQILFPKELEISKLIGEIRNTGREVFEENNIYPMGAREFLVEEYRRLEIENDKGEKPVNFINAAGVHAYLDTSVFSAPDTVIDAGECKLWENSLRCWFKLNFFEKLANDVIPRVSDHRVKLFLVVGSILGGRDLARSKKWPRLLI